MNIRAFAGIVAVGTLMAAATLHLALVDSFPKKDATLTESPDQIRLQFNEQPRLPLSRVGLEGPDGAVEVGDIVGTEEKSFMAEVLEILEPGVYTVSWRTAGNDGHVRRGRYRFTLADSENR